MNASGITSGYKNLTIDHLPNDLPNEILCLIISKLSIRQIVECSRIQKLWLALKEDALSEYAHFFGKQNSDPVNNPSNEAFLKAFFGEVKDFQKLVAGNGQPWDIPEERKVYYANGALNYQATMTHCTGLSRKTYIRIFQAFAVFSNTSLNSPLEGQYHNFINFILMHAEKKSDAKPPKDYLVLEFIKKGYVKIVEHLLECGANPNTIIYDGFQHGTSFLETAIRNKQYDVASLLLQKGADPNLEGTYLRPLHRAVKSGSIQATKLLLDHGADINGKITILGATPGLTPLHFAIEADNNALVQNYKSLIPLDQMIDFLTSCEGCDINSLDQGGRAPIHYAILLGNLEITALLLSKGALIAPPGSAWDHDRLTTWASDHQMDEMDALLRQYR